MTSHRQNFKRLSLYNSNSGAFGLSCCGFYATSTGCCQRCLSSASSSVVAQVVSPVVELGRDSYDVVGNQSIVSLIIAAPAVTFPLEGHVAVALEPQRDVKQTGQSIDCNSMPFELRFQREGILSLRIRQTRMLIFFGRYLFQEVLGSEEGKECSSKAILTSLTENSLDVLFDQIQQSGFSFKLIFAKVNASPRSRKRQAHLIQTKAPPITSYGNKGRRRNLPSQRCTKGLTSQVSRNNFDVACRAVSGHSQTGRPPKAQNF